MLKKITIELAGPICPCQTQSLAVSVTGSNYAGVPCLTIFCEKCGVSLEVMSSDLRTSFVLEQPYPENVLGYQSLIESGAGQTEAEKDAAFLASLKTGWLKEDEVL